MPVILPTEKVKATRFNPKIIVVYSMPKVGKTTSLRDLDGCLELDGEGGAEMYDMLRVPFSNVFEYDEIMEALKAQLNAELSKFIAEGMPPAEAMRLVRAASPYKRLAIDTLDKLEDFCEVTATAKYKASTIGSTFKGESVIELPKGAGYYHLRNELLAKIDTASRLCETLILVCHVRDKIVDKGGIEVTFQDLSLTGKLGSIVCAKSDLIIYLYREKGILMGSLTTNTSTVMGAREFPHLAPLMGKQFPFSWDKILIEAPVLEEVV
jgi:hypothetical protein